MHSKTGRGIDFDYPAAVLREVSDTFGAIMSMPATSRPMIRAIRSNRKDVLRMDLVGAVNRRSAGRNICGCLKMKYLVLWQDVVELISAALIQRIVWPSSRSASGHFHDRNRVAGLRCLDR